MAFALISAEHANLVLGSGLHRGGYGFLTTDLGDVGTFEVILELCWEFEGLLQKYP